MEAKYAYLGKVSQNTGQGQQNEEVGPKDPCSTPSMKGRPKSQRRDQQENADVLSKPNVKKILPNIVIFRIRNVLLQVFVVVLGARHHVQVCGAAIFGYGSYQWRRFSRHRSTNSAARRGHGFDRTVLFQEFAFGGVDEFAGHSAGTKGTCFTNGGRAAASSPHVERVADRRREAGYIHVTTTASSIIVIVVGNRIASVAGVLLRVQRDIAEGLAAAHGKDVLTIYLCRSIACDTIK